MVENIKDAEMLRNDLGLLYLIGKSRLIRSRIRLQKLVCINQFEEKKDSPFSFDFASHYYGPYSELLRSRVEFLKGAGFVVEEMNFNEDNPTVYSYSYQLSESGKQFFATTIKKLDGNEAKKIRGTAKTLEKYGRESTDTVIMFAKKVSGMQSIG